MGCQLYTSPGSYTFTWPDGVDRAVVSAVGGSGGGVDGAANSGRAPGGGGGFSERLLLRTDADATVVVGSGGTHAATTGGDGVDSGFSQASSGTEKVVAAAGKGGNINTGGLGGQVADSYGTIVYAGGDGHDKIIGRDGSGGGASACETGPGANGGINDGTNGGVGGDLCGGVPGAGGGGGHGGPDGGDGEDGPAGGGGGGGAGGIGGNGAAGFVSVCWEDPLPGGFCVTTGGGPCNQWWPRCGQYGYTYGSTECFYYGYYLPPNTPYFYLPGWPIDGCCPGVTAPPELTLTVTDVTPLANAPFPDQTVPLVAISVPAAPAQPLYRAVVRYTDDSPAYFFFQGSPGGTCGMWLSGSDDPADIVDDYPGTTCLTNPMPINPVSCDPLYFEFIPPCDADSVIGGPSRNSFLITE